MPLTNAQRGAIESLHDEWIALELAGRAAELGRFLAEDAVMLPPGSPPVLGRDAVLCALGSEGPPPAELTARIDDIRGGPENATKIARFAGRSADGTPFEGTHVWILSAPASPTEAKLHWRIRLLAWSFGG